MSHKIHLQNRNTIETLDWISIFLYFALVIIGWINIYSASLPQEQVIFFDISQVYTKQLVFIILCIPLIIFILSLNANTYENFALVFYVLGIIALAGLFIFGASKKGQTNWYQIGSFGIQPSEFVKIATSLLLAKYLQESQIGLQKLSEQTKAFLIIGIPIALIMLQPDLGTVIIFACFIFVLHREGLPSFYLWAALIAIICFFLALLVPLYIVIPTILIAFGIHYIRSKKIKRNIIVHTLLATLAIGFTSSVDYIFHKILEPHQKERINVLLGENVNLQKEGYNLNQSKIAIGSGGWFGKGWLEGTQTKGGFVPEQHTDYIFTTVGEEWGFVGSIVVIGIFVTLLLRLTYLAENQKTIFARVYGYSVVSILFAHFFLNIAMLIGIFPTIGIPLPLISYGGSSLIAFTIMIFIFLKLDANKVNEW